MNDGQKSINSGIQELIKRNYVHRMQKRTENGIFNGYEYLVYERPTEMPFSENGVSENGFSENGKTENRKRRTTNNNRTNNDFNNNDDTYNDGRILSSTSTADHIPYKKIIDYLNDKTNKYYKHTTGKTRRFIEARWNEKFNLDDFKKVIDVKTREWLGTEQEKYLRPETLFGTKFEGYLNQELKPSGVDQLERMKYDPSYWD